MSTKNKKIKDSESVMTLSLNSMLLQKASATVDLIT